jgi:hypothetical protein
VITLPVGTVGGLLRSGKVAHIVEAEPGQTEPRPGQRALCGYPVLGIPAPKDAPLCVVCAELDPGLDVSYGA